MTRWSPAKRAGTYRQRDFTAHTSPGGEKSGLGLIDFSLRRQVRGRDDWAVGTLEQSAGRCLVLRVEEVRRRLPRSRHSTMLFMPR